MMDLVYLNIKMEIFLKLVNFIKGTFLQGKKNGPGSYIYINGDSFEVL